MRDSSRAVRFRVLLAVSGETVVIGCGNRKTRQYRVRFGADSGPDKMVTKILLAADNWAENGDGSAILVI